MSAKGLICAVAAVAALATGASAQQRVDERLRTAATGTVEVSNTAGSVRVVGWNRNEIAVTGTLGRGAQRLELTHQGARVVVRVVLPRGGGNVRGSDLEIRVPEGKDLQVRTVSAEAEVAGVEGTVDVRSVSGEVRVEGRPRTVTAQSRSGGVELEVATERVSAETVSGEIQVDGTVRRSVYAESVSGTVGVSAATPEALVETVSGEIRLEGVGGRAQAETVSGEIEVEGRRLRGEFRSVSGDIRVAGDLDPAGTVAISTHSGDVVMGMRGTRSAEIRVATFSGEVDNELGNAPVTRSGNREWQLRLGGGGGSRVTIRTFSGDVQLGAR